MFDFHQKRKIRSILKSPFTRGVLLILVIMVGWSAFTRFQIASQMVERREAAEAELSKLQTQKKELEAEVRYLSDERGIEAEMRRQFDIALDGEQVVVIVDPQNDERKMATSTPPDAPAWYEFWQ